MTSYKEILRAFVTNVTYQVTVGVTFNGYFLTHIFLKINPYAANVENRVSS